MASSGLMPSVGEGHWYVCFVGDLYVIVALSDLRCGQAIEDKAITCNLPSKVVDGNMAKLNLIIPAVEHARMLGDILHQFTALKATTPTLTEVVQTVKNLEQRLCEWHDSLPPDLRTDAEISETSGDLDLVHILYHHYAFWGSLITIHSILVHPWNAPRIQTKPIELLDFRNHSRNSMKKVVDASRAIIQSLRHIHIDVCSPKWSENPLNSPKYSPCLFSCRTH